MASKGGRMPESYEPGDMNFHYNREEREAMLSEDTKKVLRKSKLFTLNKRNAIILIDIGVILLFVMIFFPIVTRLRSNARFDDFSAGLRAYEYDGRVLVSLKVETKEDRPDESGLVTVVFTVEGSEQSFTEVDLLPSGPGKPRMFRAEFDSADVDIGNALAEVEIGGRKRKLSAGVKRE